MKGWNLPTYKLERQCIYNVKNRHVRATVDGVEKQLSITYSERVSVVFGIQHAICIRHMVIRGLSDSAICLHIVS